jgi:uncharacterized RDD family membrane protein YckC
MVQRLGLRRVTAYVIDYGVIAVWIIVLVLAANAGWIGIKVEGALDGAARWAAQGQAFLMLTLPVYFYFTLSESFGRKATLGKRALGLRVDGSPGHIAGRNLVKFLPWELAHMGIWHGMAVPFVTEPSWFGTSLFALSLGLVVIYLMSLFISDGRTPYDRLSGTSVVINSD